ncbi:pilin [Patescibacteria group bacterium]|nr:pilin [Patescibacteria group bacterium]
MANRLKKQILLTLVCCLIILPATSILATTVEESLINSGKEAGFYKGEETASFSQALIVYANGLAGMLGVLYLILMMYAGYVWMNSRGNEEEVTKARKIIIWSTVGIGTILMALIISEFIIYNFYTQSKTP